VGFVCEVLFSLYGFMQANINDKKATIRDKVRLNLNAFYYITKWWYLCCLQL